MIACRAEGTPGSSASPPRWPIPLVICPSPYPQSPETINGPTPPYGTLPVAFAHVDSIQTIDLKTLGGIGRAMVSGSLSERGPLFNPW